MVKGWVSAVLALLIVIGVIFYMNFQGMDVGPYLALKDPAIRMMPPQRVIVVEAAGAPGKVGKKAFGLLMRAYFGTKGVPKGRRMAAPRARWPLPAGVPQEQWIGRYAMPVPDTLKAIKLPAAPEGLSIRETTWEYGQVAEILHIGPYDKEEPAIRRLHDFIASQGYRIAGEHEEEYLRGPGMFFKGNPKKYYTIIRYRVEKADTAAAPRES